MTDPISDLVIRIKNAYSNNLEETFVPFSNFKLAILDVIKHNKLIDELQVKGEKKSKQIRIVLKTSQISHIKRLSKPGKRIYVRSNEIPRPLRGMGLVIVSTPNGVISGNEARKKNIGGELICEVW